MINSSVADKRRDSFQPRISSIGNSRGSISRVAPTFYKADENEANDVEAASQQPPPLPQKSDDLLSPPKSKVLRSIRRRSSVNRTRQSIMQIINDNTPGPPRPSFVETLLSPTDWLVNPEKTPPDKSFYLNEGNSKNAVMSILLRHIYCSYSMNIILSPKWGMFALDIFKILSIQ